MTNRGTLQAVLQAWAACFISFGLVTLAMAWKLPVMQFALWGESVAPDGLEELLFRQQVSAALTSLVTGVLVFSQARRLAAFAFPHAHVIRTRRPVLLIALLTVGIGLLCEGIQVAGAMLMEPPKTPESWSWVWTEHGPAPVVRAGQRLGLGVMMAGTALVLARRSRGLGAAQVVAPSGMLLRLAGLFLVGYAIYELLLSLLGAAVLESTRAASFAFGVVPAALVLLVCGILLVWRAPGLAHMGARGREPAGDVPSLSLGVVRNLALGGAWAYALSQAVLGATSWLFEEPLWSYLWTSNVSPASAPIYVAGLWALLVLLLGLSGLAQRRTERGTTRPLDNRDIARGDVVNLALFTTGVCFVLVFGLPSVCRAAGLLDPIMPPAAARDTSVLIRAAVGIALIAVAKLRGFERPSGSLLGLELGAIAGLIGVTEHFGGELVVAILDHAMIDASTTEVLELTCRALPLLLAPLMLLIWARRRNGLVPAVPVESFD